MQFDCCTGNFNYEHSNLIYLSLSIFWLKLLFFTIYIIHIIYANEEAPGFFMKLWGSPSQFVLKSDTMDAVQFTTKIQDLVFFPFQIGSKCGLDMMQCWKMSKNGHFLLSWGKWDADQMHFMYRYNIVTDTEYCIRQRLTGSLYWGTVKPNPWRPSTHLQRKQLTSLINKSSQCLLLKL